MADNCIKAYIFDQKIVITLCLSDNIFFSFIIQSESLGNAVFQKYPEFGDAELFLNHSI